jgi:hypothetical protein
MWAWPQGSKSCGEKQDICLKTRRTRQKIVSKKQVKVKYYRRSEEGKMFLMFLANTFYKSVPDCVL